MDFWDVFWLLLIFIPLLLIWAFAIVDVFRREDLLGWQKALWLVCVVAVPFIGTLVYLVFRPPGAPGEEAELRILSDLHDRGKLTDDDFAEEKTRILK